MKTQPAALALVLVACSVATPYGYVDGGATAMDADGGTKPVGSDRDAGPVTAQDGGADTVLTDAGTIDHPDTGAAGPPPHADASVPMDAGPPPPVHAVLCRLSAPYPGIGGNNIDFVGCNSVPRTGNIDYELDYFPDGGASQYCLENALGGDSPGDCGSGSLCYVHAVLDTGSTVHSGVCVHP